MPEQLHSSEVTSQSDPSVTKQYDNTSPKSEQFQDLYKIINDIKVGMLTTMRPQVGPVSRSMFLSSRKGTTFFFLANKNSQKFSDLNSSKQVQITFQNTKTQDWVSVTGTATTASNDDPRIKEFYSSSISAWFGDLGDGVHNGKPEDPRMALIEVQSKYIVYWKTEVSTLGYMKEVAQAAITGEVAQTGSLRELTGEDITTEGSGSS